MKRNKHPVRPVQPGRFANEETEFVRVPDVQKRAGIKRGLCYRRIADGTFKSVLLRERGAQKGVRLVFWPSVLRYLHEAMTQQSTEQSTLKTAMTGGKESAK